MESDSYYYHFVQVQDNDGVASNCKRSKTSVTCDPGISEEPQAGGSSKIGGDFEVTSQEGSAAETCLGSKDDKCENSVSSSHHLDPLVQSTIMLHSVHQQLIKEVEKLRDIGRENFDVDGSLEQVESCGLGEQGFDSPVSNMTCLKERANSLGSNFEGATSLLKVKETKIAEQEGILGTRRSHEECYGNLANELEELFKQKMEAEVEYLAVLGTMHKLSVAVGNQSRTVEEQETEKAKMRGEPGDAHHKDAMLKGQTKKLNKVCEDIVRANEISMLKTSVCKYSSCFLLPLILLVIILALFYLQLSPHYGDHLVPT